MDRSTITRRRELNRIRREIERQRRNIEESLRGYLAEACRMTAPRRMS